MGRIGRGWALVKESWAVVRSDRSLLLFPVVAGICALLVAALFFGVGAGIGTAADSFWAALPFLVVGAYLIMATGQFCAVALAACARESLEGRDTTFREGIAIARGRLGIILSWAAVQLVVGAAITALQALLRETAGTLVSSLVGGSRTSPGTSPPSSSFPRSRWRASARRRRSSGRPPFCASAGARVPSARPRSAARSSW
jgi:hypothetical protein